MPATSGRGQSVVKVAAAEKLTERQALEALLIPSGNNIASLLARWDAGSEAAFAAKMNTRARQLGLRSTRYADASGADPATVSTAAGQFRLTVAALQIPAFPQIVALPQVTLPVAGVAYNVNAGLGHDGITGVKTGSSSQAGGCLAFAAIRTVAGSPVTIVGVVLGVRATAARPSELGGVISAAENLLGSVGGTWNTPGSSGPAPSWGTCPARGPPGPPRSRPPGSA
jgi:serine-type D-Ala-D-Ala carboxypeptidase (penicillin-binding protein 5/6)